MYIVYNWLFVGLSCTCRCLLLHVYSNRAFKMPEVLSQFDEALYTDAVTSLFFILNLEGIILCRLS